jgi:hypothetical protein
MNGQQSSREAAASAPSELWDSLELRLLLEGRLSPSLVATYRDRAELLTVLGPDRLGYAASTQTDPGRTAR